MFGQKHEDKYEEVVFFTIFYDSIIHLTSLVPIFIALANIRCNFTFFVEFVLARG